MPSANRISVERRAEAVDLQALNPQCSPRAWSGEVHGAGESVNCNGAKEEDNDIHIAFGAQPSTKECNSITAEISPHYRPASWNEIGHFEKWNPTTKNYDPILA